MFEAVSLATRNAITLYTSSHCTMQLGYGPTAYKFGTQRLDCGNMTPETVQDPKLGGWMRGCAVEATTETFGAGVNRGGAGLWIMQVDTDVVRAWWIPRSRVPEQLKNGTTEVINPDSWPINPVMRFTVKSCDVRSAFTNMKIVCTHGPFYGCH